MGFKLFGTLTCTRYKPLKNNRVIRFISTYWCSEVISCLYVKGAQPVEHCRYRYVFLLVYVFI